MTLSNFGSFTGLNFLYLSTASILYAIFTWYTFNDEIRQSPYFFVIGLAYAVLANFTWIILVRNINDTRQILFYSLAWDVLMAVIGWMIPIIFYHARLTLTSSLGVLLIIAGVLVLRVGES